MTDIPEDSEGYTSFHDKISKAIQESRTVFEKAKDTKQASLLSEKEKRYAEAVAHLSNNEYFKTYLEFEALEIASRLAGVFEEPPENLGLKGSALGEKCAFNKGRHYQMMYVFNTRQMLIKSHLSLTRNKIKEE